MSKEKKMKRNKMGNLLSIAGDDAEDLMYIAAVWSEPLNKGNKSANPNKAMASAFDVLDKDVEKKKGMGAIVCLYDSKLYLADDLVVLPIEYI